MSCITARVAIGKRCLLPRRAVGPPIEHAEEWAAYDEILIRSDQLISEQLRPWEPVADPPGWMTQVPRRVTQSTMRSAWAGRIRPARYDGIAAVSAAAAIVNAATKMMSGQGTLQENPARNPVPLSTNP